MSGVWGRSAVEGGTVEVSRGRLYGGGREEGGGQVVAKVADVEWVR